MELGPDHQIHLYSATSKEAAQGQRVAKTVGSDRNEAPRAEKSLHHSIPSIARRVPASALIVGCKLGWQSLSLHCAPGPQHEKEDLGQDRNARTADQVCVFNKAGVGEGVARRLYPPSGRRGSQHTQASQCSDVGKVSGFFRLNDRREGRVDGRRKAEVAILDQVEEDPLVPDFAEVDMVGQMQVTHGGWDGRAAGAARPRRSVGADPGPGHEDEALENGPARALGVGGDGTELDQLHLAFVGLLHRISPWAAVLRSGWSVRQDRTDKNFIVAK